MPAVRSDQAHPVVPVSKVARRPARADCFNRLAEATTVSTIGKDKPGHQAASWLHHQSKAFYRRYGPIKPTSLDCINLSGQKLYTEET